MIEGIYSGAASLTALERWQEAISQNLASGSLAGFKKTEVAFDGVVGGLKKLDPRSTFSPELRTIVPKGGDAISFRPGELKQTGKNTDLAIEGAGFFQVRQPDNSMGYTRNGEFHLNAENTLVTRHGHAVMGDGGPIVVDPELGPVSVANDGSISQGATVVGKVVLYDFADPNTLQRRSDGLFAPGNGAAPTLVEKPSIAQGTVETSNVSPLAEMVNLIAVSRAYEASQKVITTQDDVLRQAIQTLGNPQS